MNETLASGAQVREEPDRLQQPGPDACQPKRPTLPKALVSFWQFKASQQHSPANLARLVLGVLRSMRVLMVLPTTLKLLQTQVYRQHGHSALAQNLLHFVCSRDYLRQGLSMAARAKLALTHASVESRLFDPQYFDQVYAGDGLTLWSHTGSTGTCRIVLKMGCRLAPEGDLRISLMLGGRTLHNLCFTWVREDEDSPAIAPFIARNQSISPSDHEAREAFEREFPHNSAAFFSYAALQGLARAAGARQVLAVRTKDQILFRAHHQQHFDGAYGRFWAKLGGVDQGGLGIRIPVPFKLAPVEQLASKHRSRALKRRAHWRQIEEASRCALLARLRHLPADPANELQPSFEG